MVSHKKKHYSSLLIYIILYSVFVMTVRMEVENQSDIIVGTTFFFTLFIGYFITRQNDRYNAIVDQLTTTDGYLSYLYRVTGSVPRIQKELKKIMKEHYGLVVKFDDPSYHVKHASMTISRITASLSSITKKEIARPVAGAAWGFCFEVVSGLQSTGKKILNLFAEKLVVFQWSVVYILGLILVISFNFVHSGLWYIDLLKIAFGTSVYISILLLKQLDDLTLFGGTAGMSSVRDVLRIIDEKDAKELKG